MMTKFTFETESEVVLKVVKAILQDFEVPYLEDAEEPYNPEFVAMIKESEEQAKEGKTVKFEPGTSLWDLVSTK